MTSKNNLFNDFQSLRKKSKLLITAGITAVILILLISVTVLSLSSLADEGTSALSGSEKQVAEKAIAAQYATYTNPTYGNLIKRYYIHVDKVYATSPGDAAKYCSPRGGSKSDDANSPEYYSVNLTVSQLFSWEKQQFTYDGCYFMSHETDGHDLSRH